MSAPGPQRSRCAESRRLGSARDSPCHTKRTRTKPLETMAMSKARRTVRRRSVSHLSSSCSESYRLRHNRDYALCIDLQRQAVSLPYNSWHLLRAKPHKSCDINLLDGSGALPPSGLCRLRKPAPRPIDRAANAMATREIRGSEFVPGPTVTPWRAIWSIRSSGQINSWIFIFLIVRKDRCSANDEVPGICCVHSNVPCKNQRPSRSRRKSQKRRPVVVSMR